MGITATVVSRRATKRPPYPSGVPAGTRRTATTRGLDRHRRHETGSGERRRRRDAVEREARPHRVEPGFGVPEHAGGVGGMHGARRHSRRAQALDARGQGARSAVRSRATKGRRRTRGWRTCPPRASRGDARSSVDHRVEVLGPDARAAHAGVELQVDAQGLREARPTRARRPGPAPRRRARGSGRRRAGARRSDGSAWESRRTSPRDARAPQRHALLRVRHREPVRRLRPRAAAPRRARRARRRPP